MEKDKLKLIVKNLELLVEALKSEVYSDVESYKPKNDKVSFEDDDGYTD